MMLKKFSISLIILLSLFSCKKGEVPGLSEEEVLQESILGGWKSDGVESHLVCSAIADLANLRDKMQANLEKRINNKSLYIMRDTIYFIETPEPGVTGIRSKSAYTLKGNPMRIELENQYLVSNEYAPYYYIKVEDGRLCLYLMRQESLELIKHDGSLDGFIGLIDRMIDDAQFEFYFTPEHLELYDFLEALYGNN